ncbi:MAG: hypothetical protein KDI42_10775 [Gammaproteobacteria bacterium]|nr:hypothetical protein [Gammaproteobacteria bacterium]
MFIEKRILSVLIGGLFAGLVFAADPPPKAPDPVKPITPSEAISADDAVPFPVDI